MGAENAHMRVQLANLPAPQKWYNMRINMSNEKPMGIAAKVPRVKYSAAYSTGREHIVYSMQNVKMRN